MTILDSKTISKTLIERLKIKNVMEIPKITTISVNAGVGRLLGDKGAIEKVASEIALITGQKPVITNARKSIAAFKLREGSPVGVKVTLRGKRMVDFFTKLVNITLPRLRDFDGIDPRSLDNEGNLSIGFREQTSFPEIRYENVDKTFGLQVNIKTTAKNRERAVALFEVLGLPFKKEEKNG